MATITFSQGQFFHPYYGWFDKEPDLPNYAHRSGLITEKIGPEHFITPDHPLYEMSQKLSTQEITQFVPNSRTILRHTVGSDPAAATEYTEPPAYVHEQRVFSKMAQRLAEYDPTTAVFEESPADVYEQRDLSYYLDGTTKLAGSYVFVYEGNTMTVKFDFGRPAGNDPIDVVALYEEHRANIQSLKKQGFHDDTVKMLMDAVNEAFVNTRCSGLEGQLMHFNPGMSRDQAKDVTKSFFEEYIRVRNGASSMKSAMITAGNALKSQGLMHSRVDVTTDDSRKVGQSQKVIDAFDELDAYVAASPEHQKRMAEMAAFTPLDVNAIKDTTTWDPSETHIRNIDSLNRLDYSKNTTMSDIEKEARSLSIVFRVRGDQMIDYARRYEEIMGQLDSKLSSGEISQEHYDRYRADLDTAFIKTHNLNIKGQAMAAGLSESKATELAKAFSKEYIKIRGQAKPDEIDAAGIANATLKKIESQGWPSFSLYSSENRATVSGNDPWYAMMAENALYWQNTPQPYEYW